MVQEANQVKLDHRDQLVRLVQQDLRDRGESVVKLALRVSLDHRDHKESLGQQVHAVNLEREDRGENLDLLETLAFLDLVVSLDLLVREVPQELKAHQDPVGLDLQDRLEREEDLDHKDRKVGIHLK